MVRDGEPNDGGLEETYFNVTVVDGPAPGRPKSSPPPGWCGSPGAATDSPNPRPAAGTRKASDNVCGQRHRRRATAAPWRETDYATNDATKPGINALLQADLFNLLCIPPPTLETDVDTTVWVGRQGALLRPAGLPHRRPPELGSDLTSVQSLPADLAGLDARNAAVYFPRILGSDPLRGGATGELRRLRRDRGRVRAHRRQPRRVEGAGRGGRDAVRGGRADQHPDRRRRTGC